MVDRLVEFIFYVVMWAVQGTCLVIEATQNNDSRRAQFRSSRFHVPPAPTFPRAILIASSSISFGNACERLVNIAFETSQTFATMMSTCAEVNQYLTKELVKQYPDEEFHIVIGENSHFGFAIDDAQYFAEIEQERYRVLIFSTKRDPNTKADTHDANTQMTFKWD